MPPRPSRPSKWISKSPQTASASTFPSKPRPAEILSQGSVGFKVLQTTPSAVPPPGSASKGQKLDRKNDAITNILSGPVEVDDLHLPPEESADQDELVLAHCESLEDVARAERAAFPRLEQPAGRGGP